MIDRLKGQGEVVDESFISRISKLPVAERPSATDGSVHQLKEDISPRTWLVGLRPVEEKTEEQAFVGEGLKEAEELVSQEDSSVSSIRFRGSSRFRREAREGDLVVCIWTADGKGKPNAVHHHAPILLRKDDPAKNATWFFVEEYPDAEETMLTWRQFRSLYAQIGIPGRLGQWTTRELADHHSDALHNLWFNQK